MKSSNKEFYIIAEIDHQKKHIKVVELETSDGVPYYSCLIGENEISQVRNETYGNWEQLWGNLPKEIVEYIGNEIDKQITPP
jgi:hypothetical protein